MNTGRAFCTLAGGYFDLEEDIDKGYAGSTLTKLMKEYGWVDRDFA